MDKNTQILFFIGFILLCLYLSCKNKEGFVTINSNFFCTDNSDTSTCNISLSGSTGYICSDNGNNVYYTETIPDGEQRNLASGSFNISVSGCSETGYPNGEQIFTSTCSHSGEEYTLSGCSPKCTAPQISSHYNLGEFILPNYISPLEEGGITDTTMTCNNNMGYYDAINTCFDLDTGEPTSSLSDDACNGVWYDGERVNGVKLVCNAGSHQYKIIGCEQGCFSRIRDGGEYYTLDDNDRDKELVQILDRSDNGDTTLKKPSSTLYNVTENNITPSSEFNVSVTGGETSFKSNPSDDSEAGISVNFSGDISGEAIQRCDSDNRKYIVSGLFPVCENYQECLNFSVQYGSITSPAIPENIYNINDFKQHLSGNITEILGVGATQGQIDDYIKSLYYYRRYKDRNGYIHVEGQLRCDTDDNSPFYCEIGQNRDTWVLGALGANCTDTCAGAGDGTGFTCSTEREWGVNDGDSFNAAMGVAGEGACTSLVGASTNFTSPGVNSTGECFALPEGTPPVCSGARQDTRRLCRCRAP
jgi:hypothetical protein